MPVGQERRIIAETGGAARRPDQSSIGAGLDLFEMAVGPGDAQRGYEMRLALVRRGGAAFLQQTLDPAHRRHEILALAGPARREDAGCAVQRIDHEAGIVGKGRQLRRLGGGDRLDRRIGAKRLAGFLGLAEAQFARGNGFDAMRRQQFPHLGELAGIVGRDHEPAGDSTVHVRSDYATAIFCKSTRRATPLRASSISARNSSCENGVFSAVPCTSMMRPSPVMTKLASVSASESSA